MRFESVPATEEQSEESAAIILGTTFEWKITKDVKFELEHAITAPVPVPDTEDYSHHFKSELSIDLTGNFELDISLTWDRNNAQTPAADGSRPDADDYRTVIGVSYDF